MTQDQYNTIKAHPQHLLLTANGLYYRGAELIHIVSETDSADPIGNDQVFQLTDEQFNELTELAFKRKTKTR